PLSNFEQVFALSEGCFRLFDLGIGYIELRGQITGIKLEKRLAGSDTVSPFDINGIDDSRHRRADSDIPRAGFDEAGTRNIIRKGRLCGGQRRWSGRRALTTEYHSPNRGHEAKHGDNREHVFPFHCSRPRSLPSTIAVILPSSMHAIRSANSKMRVS